MHTDLDAFCIGRNHSVRDVIACMDLNRRGIVLVVSEKGKLLGTITDGDVRRAMLNDIDLEAPLSVLLARKVGTKYEKPVTARVTSDSAFYIEILQQHNILHLPIVDARDRVVGLVTRDEFFSGHTLPLHAVIMAGGSGSRLMPL